MIRAAIQTELDSRNFAPGETLRGRVQWHSDADLTNAELRLFYYTAGKGSRDTEVIAVRPWPAPPQAVDEEFSFDLPAGPYSFSGTLISLVWAIELVLEPGGHHERLEFVVSPTGHEIDLSRYPVPPEFEDGKSATRWHKAGRAR